jgi:hypothetical protein
MSNTRTDVRKNFKKLAIAFRSALAAGKDPRDAKDINLGIRVSAEYVAEALGFDVEEFLAAIAKV